MKYGLIGYPLGHSMSPQLHGLLGIENYELLPLPPENLEAFLLEGDFLGLNVTIPYKRAVMAYCDKLSSQAEDIGSVNTLLRDKQGRLHGYNTDYVGLELLAKALGICFAGKRVLILGSGGASLTCRAVAKNEGAAEIRVVSRQGPVNYKNVYEFRDTEIIINATPVGMYPNLEEKLLELKRFPNLEAVLDLIYNPLRSALLLDAEELGLPHANGLLMLAQQAKAAEEIFLNKEIPDSHSWKAKKALEKQMTNIVLIGMPGCGKSTIARQLADLCGREYLDLDILIQEQASCSIPQIFQKEGENGFRLRESAALRELAGKHGKIIACGGGTVLSPENRRLLRQNGRIYLLKGELSRLERRGRPLSDSPEALVRLARDRGPIYEALADAAFCNDFLSESAARQIKEDFDAHFNN
ncbi:MAG: shikimate kinase [Bacillota bacterium]|nr:shikimate kinase [Bacillota bacterium]